MPSLQQEDCEKTQILPPKVDPFLSVSVCFRIGDMDFLSLYGQPLSQVPIESDLCLLKWLLGQQKQDTLVGERSMEMELLKDK